jgi:hypothetical protein
MLLGSSLTAAPAPAALRLLRLLLLLLLLWCLPAFLCVALPLLLLGPKAPPEPKRCGCAPGMLYALSLCQQALLQPLLCCCTVAAVLLMLLLLGAATPACQSTPC